MSRRPNGGGHRHNFRPILALGENSDGSAKWWECECGKRIRHQADYAVMIGSRR